MHKNSIKIAKIFTGNPDNQKGQFNNIVERTKRLKTIEPTVDCYIIRFQYSWFGRLLKRQCGTRGKSEFVEVQGIKFKNVWVTLGLVDYLIANRLHLTLAVANRQLKKCAALFKDYDLLSVHTHEAVVLATAVRQKFGIPFVSTWHGTDIHVLPFRNSISKKQAAQALDAAEHNFFVSKKLMSLANTLSLKKNKSVLYTGPADFFYRYIDEKIKTIKSQYQLNGHYVVGFIGNLVPVKNVLALPSIFKAMQKQCNGITFVIVGDGGLSDTLKSKLNELEINNTHFIGKLAPEQVPDILNCMDVLLLPSLNEGLPRVTLEAQACGVPVVGSNRGGIPEAIGNDNCFELDEKFAENISKRAVELMQSDAEVSLPSRFSWENALKMEKACHERVVGRS